MSSVFLALQRPAGVEHVVEELLLALHDVGREVARLEMLRQVPGFVRQRAGSRELSHGLQALELLGDGALLRRQLHQPRHRRLSQLQHPAALLRELSFLAGHLLHLGQRFLQTASRLRSLHTIAGLEQIVRRDVQPVDGIAGSRDGIGEIGIGGGEIVDRSSASPGARRRWRWRRWA